MKKSILLILFVAAAVFPAAASDDAPENEGDDYREYQTLRFDGSGTILGYAVHDYNDAGLKQESRWYNEEGKYEMVTMYEYDEQENLIKESHFDKSESILFSYTVHNYDEAGRRVTSMDFNSDDKEVLWIDYSEIDTTGGVPRIERGYAADGRPIFRVENELDSEARKSESTVYELSEEGESPGSHSVYTYNDAGNLIKTEIFTPENTLIWYMEHKWEKAD